MSYVLGLAWLGFVGGQLLPSVLVISEAAGTTLLQEVKTTAKNEPYFVLSIRTHRLLTKL